MAANRPKKTKPELSTASVNMQTGSRFNPIRGLTPDRLARYLDQFDAGHLAPLAHLMAKIEERDDMLISARPKRLKSVSRHGWEIIMHDDSPEAQAQKEALEYFFGGLTATSAVDEDVEGDINMLMEQMMDAEGKRWACHEIVYRPSAEGLTAQFRSVPLWFFEHKTSRLRFLKDPTSTDGEELERGEWMVTRGTGVMVACCILYVFKHMPLKDLLNYCERYAIPGLHGKTDAPKGSAEWNAMRDALAAFAIDWSLITNTDADIDTIDVSASGELPHPAIIERMDRAMSAIWRGGDLATMSASDSVGSEMQDGEKEILEDADIEMIEGTLNRKVVPNVIWYTRGTRAIKASFVINRPHRQDTEQERETDTFLIQAGCPVSINDLLERYGRPQPDEGEALATWSESGNPAAAELVNANPLVALLNAAANTQESVVELGDRKAARLQQAAVKALAEAVQSDLRPLANRLQDALALEDDAAMLAELRKIQGELPTMLALVNKDPAAAAAIEDAMSAALINGYAEGIVSHQPSERGDA